MYIRICIYVCIHTHTHTYIYMYVCVCVLYIHSRFQWGWLRRNSRRLTCQIFRITCCIWDAGGRREKWFTVKRARAGTWNNTNLMTSDLSARGNGQNRTAGSTEWRAAFVFFTTNTVLFMFSILSIFQSNGDVCTDTNISEFNMENVFYSMKENTCKQPTLSSSHYLAIIIFIKNDVHKGQRSYLILDIPICL